VFWLCSQHAFLLGQKTAYDGEDGSQTAHLRSGPAPLCRLATTAGMVTFCSFLLMTDGNTRSIMSRILQGRLFKLWNRVTWKFSQTPYYSNSAQLTTTTTTTTQQQQQNIQTHRISTSVRTHGHL